MTHGLTATRLYKIFTNMKQRCCNPNDPKYVNYGGKGVKICNEWLNNFQAFNDWAMANGYQDDLTIDRIDSDSNYSPDNCRWISHEANRLNRKKGQIKSLAELQEACNMRQEDVTVKLGIDKSTVSKRKVGNTMKILKIREERIKRGWTQKHVGKLVGLQHTTIQAIETNRRKHLTKFC